MKLKIYLEINFLKKVITAKRYGLNFQVSDIINYGKSPSISCDRDQAGSSINSEMADFLNCRGVELMTELIHDINQLDPFNNELNDYDIAYGYCEIYGDISSPPARIIFNQGGGFKEIPLEDFLAITQEWIDFLNSLDFEHDLSNK